MVVRSAVSALKSCSSPCFGPPLGVPWNRFGILCGQIDWAMVLSSPLNKSILGFKRLTKPEKNAGLVNKRQYSSTGCSLLAHPDTISFSPFPVARGSWDDDSAGRRGQPPTGKRVCVWMEASRQAFQLNLARVGRTHLRRFVSDRSARRSHRPPRASRVRLRASDRHTSVDLTGPRSPHRRSLLGPRSRHSCPARVFGLHQLGERPAVRR